MSKADFMEDSFIKLMGTWDNDATWRITETPHAEFLKARNIPVNDAVDILFTDCIYEPLEGEQLPQLLRQMRANAVSLVRCPDSPSSRRAWLDDRNAENATGGYRQYSNPLTPVQLYERLKQPRFGHHNNVDCNRRLLYIKNLDGPYIYALAETAAFYQINALKAALSLYLNFDCSLALKFEVSAPVYRLELHLPFWKFGHSSDSSPPHAHAHLPWLSIPKPGFSFASATLDLPLYGGFSKQRVSITICGTSYKQYTVWAFTDSSLELDEDEGDADQFVQDPIAYPGLVDANCPILDARDYFLTVFQHRITQITREWKTTVYNVQKHFSDAETSINSTLNSPNTRHLALEQIVSAHLWCVHMKMLLSELDLGIRQTCVAIDHFLADDKSLNFFLYTTHKENLLRIRAIKVDIAAVHTARTMLMHLIEKTDGISGVLEIYLKLEAEKSRHYPFRAIEIRLAVLIPIALAIGWFSLQPEVVGYKMSSKSFVLTVAVLFVTYACWTRLIVMTSSEWRALTRILLRAGQILHWRQAYPRAQQRPTTPPEIIELGDIPELPHPDMPRPLSPDRILVGKNKRPSKLANLHKRVGFGSIDLEQQHRQDDREDVVTSFDWHSDSSTTVREAEVSVEDKTPVIEDPRIKQPIFREDQYSRSSNVSLHTVGTLKRWSTLSSELSIMSAQADDEMSDATDLSYQLELMESKDYELLRLSTLLRAFGARVTQLAFHHLSTLGDIVPLTKQATGGPGSAQQNSINGSRSVNWTTTANHIGASPGIQHAQRTSFQRTDGDGEEEETPGRGYSRQLGMQSSTMKRQFACPFFKQNTQYRRQRSCCGPGWPTVHRTKEHVYRTHRRPQFCARCSATFESEALLYDHQTSLQPCMISETPRPVGITADQERMLRSRTGVRGMSEEDKWNYMFRVLFPDAGTIPSPYTDPVNEHEARVLGAYRMFLVQRLPSGISARLAGTVSIENIRRAVVETIEIVSRDFEYVRDMDEHPLSSSNATMTSPSTTQPTTTQHSAQGFSSFGTHERLSSQLPISTVPNQNTWTMMNDIGDYTEDVEQSISNLDFQAMMSETLGHEGFDFAP